MNQENARVTSHKEKLQQKKLELITVIQNARPELSAAEVDLEACYANTIIWELDSMASKCRHPICEQTKQYETEKGQVVEYKCQLCQGTYDHNPEVKRIKEMEK